MLDCISYTNSRGETLNLRSEKIRSNPKGAKPFMYTSDSNAFNATHKEFSLNLIIIGNSVVNDTMLKLTADISTSKLGYLSINQWNLRCKCIGISNVIEDEWGVISLNVNFYAPTSKWYKNGDWKVVGSDWGIITTLPTTFEVSADIDRSHLLLDSQIKIETDVSISSIYYEHTWVIKFDYPGEEPVYGGLFTNVYSDSSLKSVTGIDEFRYGEYGLKYTKNLSGYINSNYDIFKRFPGAEYSIHNTIERCKNVTALKIRAVEWSDFPLWQTI